MLCVLLALVLGAAADNVLQLDLSPEEAARFLASKPFATPALSDRTETRPLVRWDDARFRAADAGPTLGHYWRGGHEIQNTEDYVEEVYDAAQYHGQDGLGAYAYGYRAPESAKTEERARSGDVTGQYVFRDGDNRLVQVRYWADSEGFHQEDNVPRDLPQETPEVQAARAEHARAWQEAAAAAAAAPDEQDYRGGQTGQQYVAPQHGGQQPQYGGQQLQYGGQQNYGGQQYAARSSAVIGGADPATAASAQHDRVVAAPDHRQGAASDYRQGAASDYRQGTVSNYQQGAVSNYQQGAVSNYQQGAASKLQEPEPTGPPRGFFYSYTYPVSVIVDKHQQQGVDHDTVGAHA